MKQTILIIIMAVYVSYGKEAFSQGDGAIFYFEDRCQNDDDEFYTGYKIATVYTNGDTTYYKFPLYIEAWVYLGPDTKVYKFMGDADFSGTLSRFSASSIVAGIPLDYTLRFGSFYQSCIAHDSLGLIYLSYSYEAGYFLYLVEYTLVSFRRNGQIFPAFPFPITLRKPENDTILITSANEYTFSWQNHCEPAPYLKCIIQIDSLPSFSRPCIQDTTPFDSAITVNISPIHKFIEKPFYWRVLTFHPLSNDTAFSDVFSFYFPDTSVKPLIPVNHDTVSCFPLFSCITNTAVDFVIERKTANGYVPVPSSIATKFKSPNGDTSYYWYSDFENRLVNGIYRWYTVDPKTKALLSKYIQFRVSDSDSTVYKNTLQLDFSTPGNPEYRLSFGKPNLIIEEMCITNIYISGWYNITLNRWSLDTFKYIKVRENTVGWNPDFYDSRTEPLMLSNLRYAFDYLKRIAINPNGFPYSQINIFPLLGEIYSMVRPKNPTEVFNSHAISKPGNPLRFDKSGIVKIDPPGSGQWVLNVFNLNGACIMTQRQKGPAVIQMNSAKGMYLFELNYNGQKWRKLKMN